MTTIKHCLPGGEEFIYVAKDEEAVNFVPKHAKSEGSIGPDRDSLLFYPVWARPGEHERFELTGGRAYVMNVNGATIATYWLGGMTELPPAVATV